jgi:hypothetical protein
VGGKGSCWQRDCGVVFFFYEWRGTLWSGEGVATERGMRGRWRGWERAGKGGRAAASREK